ncbi:MAG: hypothetical protein N3A01_06215 [Bacteroidales bacterium]|nr:hypothetical protein [Bacteroidales bacterium]
MQKFLYKIILLILFFLCNCSSSAVSDESCIKPRRIKFKRTKLGSNFIGVKSSLYFIDIKGYSASVFFDFFAESEDKFFITLNFGGGYINAKNEDKTFISNEYFIPVSGHLIYGDNSYFDFGIGASYFITRKIIDPYFYIGYRFQPSIGGLSFKAGAEMLIDRLKIGNLEAQKIGLIGITFSIGYSF